MKKAYLVLKGLQEASVEAPNGMRFSFVCTNSDTGLMAFAPMFETREQAEEEAGDKYEIIEVEGEWE